jgi:type IV pilus modification protein PilV
MNTQKHQKGMLLVEVLVALLLFVVGIVGLINTMGISQKAMADTASRSESSTFTSDIVQKIRVAADTSSLANFQTSLQAFQHLPTTTSPCVFAGAASGNAIVTAWVADVLTGAGRLPGSTATMQQILVDTSATGFNKITVTVCWKGPNDLQLRKNTYTAYVNANF